MSTQQKARNCKHWVQEELEQWSVLAKQKEDDSLAMEKYMRQDEARVKELNMQVCLALCRLLGWCMLLANLC